MRVIIVLVALGVLSGCQTMVYKTGRQIGVHSGVSSGATVGVIVEDTKAHYLFWGLLPVSRPNLEEIAKTRCGTGQYVGNIHVDEVNSFVDGLCAYLTYGLYRPRSVKIVGQILQKG